MNILSTRELALLIWLLVIFVLILTKSNVRKSINGVLRVFLSKHILKVFVPLAIYIFFLIYLLYYFGFWDKSLAKDTVLWFFTVALVTVFNINKANDFVYFKEIFLDSIKWTIIVEFLVNFYTFSLWIELILIPIMFFIILMKVYSETDGKYKQVEKLFSKILILIGLLIIVYIIYESTTEYQQTFTPQNLKALIHPIIMTVIFLPFSYFLALYMIYELLFIRVTFLARDERTEKRLKRQIIWSANFNINRLSRVSKNLNVQDFTPDDVKGFVKRII